VEKEAKEALGLVLEALKAVQYELSGLRVAVVEFQIDEPKRHERLEAQLIAQQARTRAIEQRISTIPCVGGASEAC
jgi:hypothetical protein